MESRDSKHLVVHPLLLSWPTIIPVFLFLSAVPLSPSGLSPTVFQVHVTCK